MRNINKIIALSLMLFSSAAFAQDNVNAHGFYMTPTDGDLLDGLSTWRAERHEADSIGVNGLFEYAVEPLTQYNLTSGVTTSNVLINDLSAANLGLFYAPHERISLTAAAPLYLAVDGIGGQTGIGLGDLRVAGSVGVLLPREDEVSLSLSVVPFLDIPGPYDSQAQLGIDGLSGGGLAAVSVGDDRWDLSGNLGVQFTPSVSFFNLEGEERLVSAVSGAVLLSDDVGLRGEWIFRPTLNINDIPMTDSPMEAMLSLKGHTGNHLGWTFGGATALSAGTGAATWRMFAGLDLAFGAREYSFIHVGCATCTDAIGSEIVVYPVYENGITPVEDAEVLITDGTTVLNISGVEDPIYLPDGESYAVRVAVPFCDEPPLVVIEGERLLLMEPILFDFDQDSIRIPDSRDILEALVDTLSSHEELTLVGVASHTDERGSDTYNEDLSQRRMNSVVRYLADHGIDESRLEPVGYGERHLLDENCGSDEECHQLNRRVEFTILERE